MDAISKNIIFYITIVDNDKTEHSFLRNVIHKVLPQAIVESVYDDNEAMAYFNNCSIIPHLIFLDRNTLTVSGENTINLIKGITGLHEVPVVFLSDLKKESQEIDFIKPGVSHFYSKPYEAKDLMNIVGSVNSKWLA